MEDTQTQGLNTNPTFSHYYPGLTLKGFGFYAWDLLYIPDEVTDYYKLKTRRGRVARGACYKTRRRDYEENFTSYL
jgi:hypothetical protein